MVGVISASLYIPQSKTQHASLDTAVFLVNTPKHMLQLLLPLDGASFEQN